MQEVVGALAGWFNILSGHIYHVGDRIQLGGVQGDVLDVSLLRTKILEIYVWEELTLPVPYACDCRVAERILLDEVRAMSDSEGARRAMAKMEHDYPMERADVEPAVYVSLTPNWIELAVRFVVPVRQSRRPKDELSRRILARLHEEGIPVAFTTLDVTVSEA